MNDDNDKKKFYWISIYESRSQLQNFSEPKGMQFSDFVFKSFLEFFNRKKEIIYDF